MPLIPFLDTLQILDKPNAERTQRLFASLRDELEKRGARNSGSKGLI